MSLFAVDLGNSRTKIAMIENDGRAVLVPNTLGEPCTPSVVYFPSGSTPVVGSEAVNMAFVEPDKVVSNWKRHMGKGAVLHRAENGKEWKSGDVATCILGEVKRSIEARTGEVASEITITVPANYTEAQKAETIAAAETAGMKVLCLPSEPVAAAFGNDIHLRGDGFCVVFDLGGGTFDVSLIEVRGNLFEVVRTNGDPELGGQDINMRIKERALEMFDKENSYIPDPQDNPVFYADLEARIEQLKTSLTVKGSARLIVRDGSNLLNQEIRRDEVDVWIRDLVERAINKVNQTIEEGDVSWNDISIVLAVGGGSRFPIIGQELEKLSGKNLSQKVEPDYAAALGGITAARIELQRQGRETIVKSGALPRIDLHAREVTSHPLGVLALDGNGNNIQHVVLQKGTPYPSTQVKVFTLTEPNQTEARIIILEGDEGGAESKCEKLGEFQLEGLPPYPDLTERIEVTYVLSSSGLLEATARDLKGGITADMQIAYHSREG